MSKKTEEEIQAAAPVISAIGLTIQEAAACLRIHPRSVFALIEKQGLPARKVAGGWRIEQEALRRWLAAGCDKPVKYNHKESKSEQETKPEPMRRTKMPKQAASA